MKNKRIFSFLLLIVAVIALVGCSGHEASEFWENFVDAVNEKQFAEVAKSFYPESSTEYNDFVSSKENEYFKSIESIETESFELIVDCDYSTEDNARAYHKALVKAKINGTSQEFNVYTNKNNSGLFFANPITFEENKVVSEPSELWLSEVYYTTEQFKYSYKETEGVVSATILRQIKNEKEVKIPSTLKTESGEDVTVTAIGEYAFYQFGKVLCFTTAKSKMESVVIPETVTSIQKYAFFQCVDLKKVEIPKAVTVIDEMAFTGCTGLETIRIKTQSEKFNEVKIESVSTGGEDNPLVINNARNLQLGEIYKFTIENKGSDLRLVKWSSKSTNVNVNADTGEVLALTGGQAVIRVELRDNPQVYAEVTINIQNVQEGLSIDATAFNRCKSLKELYIDAANPNSIKIKNGTKLNLNDTVKIIVPKNSKAMYAANETWKSYSAQIYEME